MDNLLIPALMLLLVAAWWIHRRLTRSARDHWEDGEHRPALIRDSHLFMSEQYIRCDRPVPLCGRVDQVYRLATGALCLVDTKTRRTARVYLADVVQVSVYALILRTQGHTIHPVGFIRVVAGNQVRYIPIELLDPEQVIALYHHRQTLLRHPDQASLSPYPRLCETCGQRAAHRCRGA